MCLLCDYECDIRLVGLPCIPWQLHTGLPYGIHLGGQGYDQSLFETTVVQILSVRMCPFLSAIYLIHHYVIELALTSPASVKHYPGWLSLHIL